MLPWTSREAELAARDNGWYLSSVPTAAGATRGRWFLGYLPPDPLD